MTVKFPEVQRKRIVELAQRTLWEDDGQDVAEALAYLREKRHLSDEIIKAYNFGYIPKSARHTWSERIIMPLYDPYDQLVVMTSRKFRSDEQYSHLHEVFDKRYYLYGLNRAKKNILKLNKAVIVEGQFDTTYLQTRGFRTVVGVLGSAFTFEHACILRRYCSEIYFLFDSDKAGRSSLERSLEMVKEENLEGVFRMSFIPVLLPSEFKDPDDFVFAKGPKALCELLETAKNDKPLFSRKRT